MGYAFLLFGVPISLFSIFGNLLTIIAVIKTRSLRDRNAFLPTTSLAFSDLMFSILCCPVNYVTTLMEKKEINPRLCSVNGFLGILFCLTSILTLSLLSVERYACIVMPFRYAALMTSKRIKILLCLQWIFSAIIAAVPLSGWGNYVFYPQKGFCFIDYSDISAFLFIGVWIYVCFGFIIFSYYKIFRVAKLQKRRIRAVNYPRENTGETGSAQQLNVRHRVKQENKTAMTIFAIISAFVICWAPFCCVNFTAALLHYDIPESLDVSCTLLVSVGACVNPFLYGWLDISFRTAFKRLLEPTVKPCLRRTIPRA